VTETEVLARIAALCDEPSAAATDSIDLSEVRAILATVTPGAVPPQTIDRDALIDALVRPVDTKAIYNHGFVDGVYQGDKNVRSNNVVLSREDAEWLRPVLRSMLAPHPAFVIEHLADKVSALVARLEEKQ
jgi:hypothetical protein